MSEDWMYIAAAAVVGFLLGMLVGAMLSLGKRADELIDSDEAADEYARRGYGENFPIIPQKKDWE